MTEVNDEPKAAAADTESTETEVPEEPKAG